MGCNGIDISNNNGRLDLTRGFSGLDFVIAKATEGTAFVDDTLAWYHSQARAAGTLFGAYHFGHPEQEAGHAEAHSFHLALAAIGGPASGWSLWYDYEAPAAGWATKPDNDAGVITDFIGSLKDACPRAKVGIYSNLDGFSRILPILHATGIHVYDALWLADPGRIVETPDAPLAKWDASWNVHQYETFNGIDRDYSRWSKSDMQAAFAW